MTDTGTVIANIPKNSREELRISLDEYKGHKLLHLRAWVAESNTPTKSGFGIQMALIPKLRVALADAEAKAREMGWLGPEGPAP
jgi:hypothetical protein